MSSWTAVACCPANVHSRAIDRGGGKLHFSSEIHLPSDWDYPVGGGFSVGLRRSRLSLSASWPEAARSGPYHPSSQRDLSRCLPHICRANDELTATTPREDACVAAPSDCNPMGANTIAVITPKNIYGIYTSNIPYNPCYFFTSVNISTLKNTRLISGERYIYPSCHPFNQITLLSARPKSSLLSHFWSPALIPQT